ncbi:acetylcholine receptor subunit delta-like [Pomacea canaliculata]|uniref:acetylcholine receptor subunit delta-like n=1 Tax=Pomacea canaliculata TaxID=400727 RepID=UPI000D739A40|nr:acetylcholine receptor subunit delta-like [Pomacea canaliculata]
MATKGQAASKLDYYNLWEYLFGVYNKDVRPVNDDEKITVVYAAFSLFSIVEMDEQAQRMKTNGLLKMSWYDDYLSWNEENFGNISSILVKQSYVWLPDLVVENTVTTQTQLGYSNLQVRITSEGFISWQLSEIFETSCNMDVTYYPFDTQVCFIKFTSAMSTREELYILIFTKEPIDMNNFYPDGVWEVVNTSARDQQMENQSVEDEKARIVFSLQLKRRPAFYVLNIILPVVLLAMTSSLVFALPAESGEKMSLSITVLLAFAVYLTLLTDAMPKTSVQVSVLMVYVILLMALTAFSVILSVPLLGLHHRPTSKPLGKKTTQIILFLQKIMCKAEDRWRPAKPDDKMSFEDDDNIAIVGERKKQKNKLNVVVPYDERQEADDSRCGSASSVRSSTEVTVVSSQLAAEMLTTLLFFVFLFLVVISTIICAVVLVVGGSRQEESTRLT